LTGKKSCGNSSCCAGPATLDTLPSIEELEPEYVTGWISRGSARIPQVATRLTRRDLLDSWNLRWRLGRPVRRVPPGLYAVGNPGETSPVLVSANYKMSFDHLRSALSGLDAWVLVIETAGINVWCSAGKGTFNAREIHRRITETRLQDIVTHRTLVLPQLSAPGVDSNELSRLSGFRAVFGPVKAADIPGFLRAGMRATPEMRRVRFGFWERVVLTPVEVVGIRKWASIGFLVLLAATWLRERPVSPGGVLYGALLGAIPYAGAVLVGSVVVPALLPYVPGRALSFKGALLGLLWALVYVTRTYPEVDWVASTPYILVLPAISSFLALNFTGSTTYTSLSGVLEEMRVALPSMIVAVVLGAGWALVSALV